MQIANCNSALELFPELNLNTLLHTINEFPKSYLLRALANKACGERIKDESIEIYKKSNFFSKNSETLFELINEQLNKKNIIGISYDSKVLYNKDYDYKLGRFHSSIVVGRRFNPKTNECEYLIRNSWGRGCRSYDNRYDCEEGNVWIPKLALYRGIVDATFIK